MDAGVALSLAAHNSLCSAHIYLAGTEEQKRRYLRPSPGARRSAAGASPRAARARTRAGRGRPRCGTGPLGPERLEELHHQRRIADTAVVMAVTDETQGKKGISAFMVERGTQGFRAGKKEDKLGVRSSDTSELVFEDCRVPAANLLGREGKGFVDTLKILDRGRIGIAAFSVGIAPGLPRGVHALRPRAEAVRPSRSPNSRPSSSRSRRWPRRSTRRGCSPARAASLPDAGKDHTAESAMAKLFASETAVRGRPRGDPDPRRVRLHQGLPGGALPARREARHHRRGHERGPAPGDRARAAAPAAGGAVVAACRLDRPVTASSTGVAAPATCARWRGRSRLVEDGRPEAAGAPRRALPPRRARPGRRRHRTARGGEVDPRRPPDRPPAQAGQDGGHRGRGPDLALQRRRHPGRPHPHAGPRHRSRRLHPLDGHARAPGRPRRRHRPGAPRARRPPART